MKVSVRLALLACAFAMVTGSAQASHVEVDTYYGTTAGASVVHVAACGGPEHVGGGCFQQFDDPDNVVITADDEVATTIGYAIVFRPAAGADLARHTGCLTSGTALPSMSVPSGTSRIVVFLGTVVDTTTNTPVCVGGEQPTTGTISAAYDS